MMQYLTSGQIWAMFLLVFTWPGRVPGVGGLVGLRVHTSAYTAHRVAMAEKLWFTGKSRSKMSFENVNSLWGGVTVLTAGLERRVPRVSDLMVVAGEGWPLQTD